MTKRNRKKGPDEIPVLIKRNGITKNNGKIVPMRSAAKWVAPDGEKHLTFCETNGEINIHPTDELTGEHDKGIVLHEIEGLFGDPVDINDFKLSHTQDNVVFIIDATEMIKQIVESVKPIIETTIEDIKIGHNVIIDTDLYKSQRTPDPNKFVKSIGVSMNNFDFHDAPSQYMLFVVDNGRLLWLTKMNRKWFMRELSDKTPEELSKLPVVRGALNIAKTLDESR